MRYRSDGVRLGPEPQDAGSSPVSREVRSSERRWRRGFGEGDSIWDRIARPLVHTTRDVPHPSSSWMEPSHAGRGPKGYRRADRRILEDANEALTEDQFIDATQIAVEAVDGDVYLKGMVPHRADRERAEALMFQVRGVRDVMNGLEVITLSGSAGYRP
jgi:hypothetical protein